MKRIAPKATYYCSFCKAQGALKVKAIWRISYDFSNYACNDHREELAKVEQKRKHTEGHYSEADYQTWMRL